MTRGLPVYRKVIQSSIDSFSGLMELMIGVPLTHGNLAIAAKSNLYGYPIEHERVTMMSYLPLAHIYEVC